MCLILSVLLFGPRIILVAWWLLEPASWAATFETGDHPHPWASSSCRGRR